MGSGGGARGHDRQRKRQPGAPGDYLVDRVRCRRQPFCAEALGQEVARFIDRRQVKIEQVRAVGRNQA
jgi:hypothetical protein